MPRPCRGRPPTGGSPFWPATCCCFTLPSSGCGTGAGRGVGTHLLPVWPARQPGAGSRRRERPVELWAARRLGGIVLARGGPRAGGGAREELPAAESRGCRVPDHGVRERRARARAAIVAGPL